jgi:PAS domain S-box-containing protein
MYGDVKLIAPLIGAWHYLPRYETAAHRQEDVKNLEALATTYAWDFPIDFLKKEMQKPRKTILVTRINRTIIYASRYFEIMTGYRREEVFGQKPDFLQGPSTDEMAVQKISHALSIPEKVSSTVVNYKKDGTPYFCDIEIFPVFNHKQQLVNFLAVEEEAMF